MKEEFEQGVIWCEEYIDHCKTYDIMVPLSIFELLRIYTDKLITLKTKV
jgi:hypothetical protein